MPGPIPTGTAAAFGLYVGGGNFTTAVEAESVRITEVGGESNATLEFTITNRSSGGVGFGPAHLSALAQDIRLEDLTNSRRLFNGNLVNARRRHFAATGMEIICTAVSLDAWLDRRVLPSWTSKRPNGTNMGSDREMVQNVTTLASAGWWDALNAYVNNTQTMTGTVVKMPQGGTAREILTAIAEAASTAADPGARRFYVDFDGHLHYFKGSESSSAPYLIGDADYGRVVKTTTGAVSYWPLGDSGSTAYDAMGNANGTWTGSDFTSAKWFLVNEPGRPAFRFNASGNTSYVTVTDSDLHQADGPWSVEAWVKRSSTGSAQVIWSGGATDVLIGFDATDHVLVQKEGTGNHFVSDNTYTSTSTLYHIVVTRTGGATTTVYVNGSSISGTTTSRTFVSAAGAVNIGRKLSTTDSYFKGTIAHVAFYSAALSAATVLAHYNDGKTIVPDDFEFETDINSYNFMTYVRGGNAVGSGWVYHPVNQGFVSQSMIDRPQSDTASLKEAIGKGFLKREGSTQHSFRATITMPASTWRAGQTVTVDNASLGIPESTGAITTPAAYEIKQLDTYPNLGSGVVTYEIYGGQLPWSGNFQVQRKKKRNRA